MDIRPTLPLFTIRTNAGLYCVPYDNDNCLLIYRTLGMAELFVRECGNPELHVLPLNTNRETVDILRMAQKAVTQDRQ